MFELIRETTAPLVDRLRILLEPYTMILATSSIDVRVQAILFAIPSFLFLAWFSLSKPSYDPIVESHEND
jgi:hypothetical protein